MARVLGIDPGTKRIGVALSDPGARVAIPHDTLAATVSLDDDARAIATLARDNDVEEIVVGYPRKLDGSVGPAAEHARDLAQRIESEAGIRVTLWDERMTSAQADKTMLEHGAKRRQRRSHADRVAATLILQSYLDARGRA
jgi:putative Holliday junction resolvase